MRHPGLQDYFGGRGYFGAGRQAGRAGLGAPRTGLGDPTSQAQAALANLQQGLPNDPAALEAQASNLQSQAMSQLGGVSGQLSAYQAQGESIVNSATQAFNDPTGAGAMQLASSLGVTLFQAAGSGQFGTIGKIAAGTIAGVTAGLAVGGPIGAVAGATFGFLESAITAATGASSTACVSPCIVSQPGWIGMGTPAGDLIAKNLYMWRQTIGTEPTSEKPVGYALYLAWTQIYPAFGSGRGYWPAGNDSIAAFEFTALAQGLTVPPTVPGSGGVPVNQDYTDSSLGYDAAQRPVSSGVTTSRGTVGQLVFNSLSDMAGGDTFAQLAVTRLPPNSFLDPVLISVAGQLPPVTDWTAIGPLPASAGTVHPALSSITQYGGPQGFYAYALMTVLGHLTVNASDQAIASELQAQLHQIESAGLSFEVVPKHLALVQWYASGQGVAAATSASGAGSPAAAVAGNTLAVGAAAGAAVVGGAAAYAAATGGTTAGVLESWWAKIRGMAPRVPRL